MAISSPHFESPEHARVYIEWAQQFERQVRADERKFIGTLLAAAISNNQQVSLQHALRKLDPDAARTAGTLIHLLTSILGEQESEQAA